MAFISATPLLMRRTHQTTSPQRRRSIQTATAALPTPLFDRILVRRDKAASTSAGGLVLTGEQEKAKMGTVLKAGPGRYSPQGVIEDMPVKEGDKIFWKDEYGAETVEGEDDLVLLRAFSVAGKF